MKSWITITAVVGCYAGIWVLGVCIEHLMEKLDERETKSKEITVK